MDEHELNALQKMELDILKEFISICENSRYRYYIWGGSLLGAVRHKGFIPWDDDVDVAMPRKDFENFLQTAPGKLRNDLYLSTYRLSSDHITLVAQIFSKKKCFLLNNSAKPVRTGAWIDILVIDGAPPRGIKRNLFAIKYMYYRMMNQFAHFDEIVNLNKKRPWYENIAIKFAEITKIENRLDPIKLGDSFHKFLKTYDYETSDDVATFTGSTKMGEIIPKSYIGDGREYQFEDLKVIGLVEYDKYLKKYFGDYMSFPPENERNRHNVTMIEE